MPPNTLPFHPFSTPTSLPTNNTLTPSPHPSADALVLPYIREVESNLVRLAPSDLHKQLSAQLQGLLEEGGRGKGEQKGGSGDAGEMERARARLVEELKELNARVLRHLQLNAEFDALHGGSAEAAKGYVQMNGVVEGTRQEKGSQRRKKAREGEVRNGKEEKRAKSKRKRDEVGEDDERRVRRRERKKQRKAKLKAKERKRQREGREGENGGGEEQISVEGKAKRRKKSRESAAPNGHLDDFSAVSSSCSVSSSSNDEDHLPLFHQPRPMPRQPSATNGYPEPREAAEAAVVMVMPASVVDEGRQERKKEKKRSFKVKKEAERPPDFFSRPPPPSPPVTLPVPVPVLVPPQSGVFNLTVDDFAPAFERLRGGVLDPGRQPAVARGPIRKRIHQPPLPDDAPGVVERSTQLSSLVFHQSDIMSMMKRAMPLDTAISMDAAALVTQALCHFIALITAEAEDGVHVFPDDEDDDGQPVQEAAPIATSAEQTPVISTEKVLDALLRLGFEDHAILCARHVQRYREEQLQDTAAPSSDAMVDVGEAASSASPSPSSSAAAAPATRSRQRAWLPATLSASYLMANAQFIDLDKFSPSIPRHPVTDGFRPHLPPPLPKFPTSSPSPRATPSSSSTPANSTTTKRKPSTSRRKPKSSSSSPSATSSAPPSVPPSAVSSLTAASRELAFAPERAAADAAALEKKKSASSQAWKRRKELTAAGLTHEDVTRVMKEERRVRDAQKKERLREERAAARGEQPAKGERRKKQPSDTQQPQQQQSEQTVGRGGEGGGAGEAAAEASAAAPPASAVAMEADAPSATAVQEDSLPKSEGG